MLGCTDMPFLASCRCWTLERVRLAGFRCPASVLFFFFCRFSDMRRRDVDTAPTQLRRGSDASNTPAVKKKKKISAYFGSFRLFRPISVEMKILSDKRFWLKKKKKIKIKILPPLFGFRAFLPPLLLLLNLGPFFFLFFFFFFWFRSATWLPLLLYLCVLAVLHLCLEFRV